MAWGTSAGTGTSGTSPLSTTQLLLSGLLSAGGALGAAALGNAAANTQANAATQGSQQAIDYLKSQDAQNRSDSAPWRVGGALSLQKLLTLMGIDTRGAISMGTSNGTATNGTPQFTSQGSSSRFMGGNAIDPDTGNPIDGSAPIPQWILNRQRTDLMPGTTDDNSQTGNMGGGMDANLGADGLPSDFGALTHRFSPADFANNADPGLEFRLAEGQKALDHSAAARGGALGGRAIKAALRYGQDYGSNEYSKAYDRFNLDNTNEFNRYATLAGFGQTSTAQTAQNSSNTASNIAQDTINGANRAADARASGYVNTGNAINGGISDFLKLLAQRG